MSYVFNARYWYNLTVLRKSQALRNVKNSIQIKRARPIFQFRTNDISLQSDTADSALHMPVLVTRIVHCFVAVSRAASDISVCATPRYHISFRNFCTPVSCYGDLSFTFMVYLDTLREIMWWGLEARTPNCTFFPIYH
jgi:hypothetical protein